MLRPNTCPLINQPVSVHMLRVWIAPVLLSSPHKLLVKPRPDSNATPMAHAKASATASNTKGLMRSTTS